MAAISGGRLIGRLDMMSPSCSLMPSLYNVMTMPELPEVETIKLGLEKLIIGKTVSSVTHDWPKSFPNSKPAADWFLINSKIVSIKRRAKVLIIDLSSEYSLVIHLKMTGQLVYKDSKRRFGAGHPSSSLLGDLPDRSTRVILTFKDGSKLFFNDQRKFGWVRLMPTIEIPNIDFMKKLGPEPLDPVFAAKDFTERIKRRASTNVKAALLDQSVIAGVGNIYADESLWGAKIHPSRQVKTLSTSETSKLFDQLLSVLKLSIQKGGSTDRNYVDARGKKGSYLSFANVFRRQGQPCPRCQTTIIKIRVAGRGTHICPNCQKVKT